MNGFELQVPGELAGYGSPQLLVTVANLNSAGGAVSVDIQERDVGKGENAARPILLRHDAS